MISIRKEQQFKFKHTSFTNKKVGYYSLKFKEKYPTYDKLTCLLKMIF
jgi:hypothetical protein